MFLSDYGEFTQASFALPKYQFKYGVPKYKSVTRRLHVRKLYGGMSASKVNPSTSIIASEKNSPIVKKVNPLKLKRRWL